ncbi:MAG: phosphoglycerate kinase [Methanobacteriota archaeon]|nr:MAG: phosphoglycerate kinase [Euryarchaeota archaeon]|tara:strand:+ start:21796 stop:23064 length:1269 start_codon:yes stop_codon:yes gene_type:complete
MGTILTLDDVFLEGKTVLLRIDGNSPLHPINNSFLDDSRLKGVIPTINRLSKTKLIILLHQSRPGKKDFTTTSGHAREFQRLLGKTVKFVEDICGQKAMSAIEELKDGDILVLNNVRMNDEELQIKTNNFEEQTETNFVQKLSSIADIFVNDAFACAHRNSPSITGFTYSLPCIAGTLMINELNSLKNVMQTPKSPCIAVLGGIKIDDSVRVAKNMLKEKIAKKILVTGGVANLFLDISGYNIGEINRAFLKKELGNNWDRVKKEIRELLKNYSKQIVLPVDVALNKRGKRLDVSVDSLPTEYQIFDLGIQSVLKVSSEIKNAGTVILNGPAGVFELEEFKFGTMEIINSCAESDAFVVVGGGHTATLINNLGLKSKINHVSTGGGACLELLAGEKLPGIRSLEISSKRFGLTIKKLQKELQ